MEYFVTSSDLQAIFKNCKIVKYADLDQYSDIYQLLSNRMDFVFLLTESEKNSGHWTLIIRDDNTFEYMDSYGTSPKRILDYMRCCPLKWTFCFLRSQAGLSTRTGSHNVFNTTRRC